MASSIKVLDSTKREIERIQAELLLKHNVKYTQQEIVDLLVKLGTKDIDKIIEIEEKYILTKEKVIQFLSISEDWGVETDASDIDDVIYGDLD